MASMLRHLASSLWRKLSSIGVIGCLAAFAMLSAAASVPAPVRIDFTGAGEFTGAFRQVGGSGTASQAAASVFLSSGLNPPSGVVALFDATPGDGSATSERFSPPFTVAADVKLSTTNDSFGIYLVNPANESQAFLVSFRVDASGGNDTVSFSSNANPLVAGEENLVQAVSAQVGIVTNSFHRFWLDYGTNAANEPVLTVHAGSNTTTMVLTGVTAMVQAEVALLFSPQATNDIEFDNFRIWPVPPVWTPPSSSGSQLVRRLAAGEPQTVVVYGTSLTAGGPWVEQMRSWLTQNYPGALTLINSGMSGKGSDTGTNLLDSKVLAFNPDVVFIEFGMNDGELESAEVRANLDNLIDRILAHNPATEIILQTMNSPWNSSAGSSISLQIRPNLPDVYQVYRDVAAARGLLLIDHYPNWKTLQCNQPTVFKAYIPDGVHPVASGTLNVTLPLSQARLAGDFAGTWSDPQVDAYNVRAGSQAFGSLYQFTTNTLLMEEAQVMLGMNSDILKFQLSPTAFPGYGSLMLAARDEPSARAVMDMPFRHFFIWAKSYNGANWKDGLTPTERQDEYTEYYALARHFLTNYNNSGKTLYIGLWEGDWQLLPLGSGNSNTNPTPEAIQGMRDWLNARQQAVDDAKAAIPHTNVNVLHYAEVNRVRDAMVGAPNKNQRVINQVVPYVTNLDLVSWSSYDGMNLDASNLNLTLNYMESNLPINKASVITGKRVFVGEYGWGGTQTPDQQEPTTRAYLQRLFDWGCPFALFWQVYNNEFGSSYCLVDSNNVKVACYYLHQNLVNAARLKVAQFKETNNRLPSDTEFGPLVHPLLNAPLSAPESITLSNHPVTSITATSADVAVTLTQGLYREERAKLWVCWGTQDAGPSPENWQNLRLVGTNTSFYPAMFTASLTNLSVATYYYRFFAENEQRQTWGAVGIFQPGASVIVDNADSSGVSISSGWTASSAMPGYYGADYLHDGGPGAGAGKSVCFRPNLPAAAAYNVWVRWTANPNRASNVPVDVVWAGATNTFLVDQRTTGGVWHLVDAFSFSAGTNGYVLVRNDGADGFVVADAVQFAPVLPALPAPSIPSGLTATASSAAVRLSWDFSPGAAGYRVFRSTLSGEPYTLQASNVTTTSWVDSGLTNGISYYYVVSAFNVSGVSNPSAEVVATPTCVLSPPSQLQSAAAEGNRMISLVWQHLPGATGYNVKRALAWGGPYTALAAVAGAGFTDTNVSSGATYFYAVSAINACGESPNSPGLSAMPSTIVDNSDAAGVSVLGSWTASPGGSGYYGPNALHDGNTGATGGKSVRFWPNLPTAGVYAVYLRWSDYPNRAGNTPVDVVSLDGTNTFAMDQRSSSGWRLLGQFRFNAGTSGFVRVRNDGANGYVSADAVQFVLRVRAPSAPGGLSAMPGTSRAWLTWNPVIEAAGYNLKRTTNPGGPYIAVAGNLPEASCLDTGLVNGVTYYYVVSTINAFGESINSPPVSVTPVAPTLGIAAVGTNVLLTWSTAPAGSTLESATTLALPRVWTTVVGITLGQTSVTLPATDTAIFYRLRVP